MVEKQLNTGEYLKVKYVRTSTHTAAGRLQEWRSTETGRVIEVLESRSYCLSVDLEPGAIAYVVFQDGKPYVLERPKVVNLRMRRKRVSPGEEAPRRTTIGGGRNWGAFLLVLALIATVAWNLL